MKQVHVAVAVIEKHCSDSHQHSVLIARRAEHQHMGGFWEFPGGKVEAGETVLQALQREIREEVGLDVHAAEPVLQIPFHYPDKRVLLDVWRVTAFSGTATSAEGQPVLWVPREQLAQYAFPPANRAILTALRLPERLLVTGAFADSDECVQRIRHAVEKKHVRAVLLRAHALSGEDYSALARAVLPLCQQYGARLLLNTAVQWMAHGADGLHLTSQRLMACQERPVPETVLFGASCHNVADIRQALAVGVDYLTLSPVLPTASHPGEPGLGWEQWAALLQQCPVPVYGLGGLDDSHLPRIKQLGGFGVAAVSAWW